MTATHLPQGWTPAAFAAVVAENTADWPAPTAEDEAEIRRLFAPVPQPAGVSDTPSSKARRSA